jgi:hypothetical protein
MRRRHAGGLALPALAGALVAGACSSTPAPLPLHDFDRPTDMVFTCMGVFNGVVSGRPMSVCHPIGSYDPTVDPNAPNAHRSFGFVTNSASGQLTVIDADAWKLVDLDPAVAGFNEVPLGIFPEQLAASDDGCRLVTANRGSCDLTLIDPAVVLTPMLGEDCPKTNGNCREPTQEIRPLAVAPDGTRTPLAAAPQEIQFLPQDISAIATDQNLCGATAPAGPFAWTASTAQWEALVTFPSCDLIALLDLPSGEIRDSVQVAKTTDGHVMLHPQGQNPRCPVDCPGQGTAATPDAGDEGGAGQSEGGVPTPDAGVDDGGAEAATNDGGAMAGDSGAPADAGGGGGTDGGSGATNDASNDAGTDAGGGPIEVPSFGPNPLRPGAIAIQPGGARAYVGLANGPFVIAVLVGADGKLAAPPPPIDSGIFLHEGARGVDRLRLSVNPYAFGVGSYLGAFVTSKDNPDRTYLYVIARDGTLRVVQVPAPGPTTTTSIVEQECETNADPLNPPSGLTQDTVASTACIQIDPRPKVAAEHRRPFVAGPGIRLPTAPIDVATASIPLAAPDTLPTGATCPPNTSCSLETTVSGAHTWIMAANGAVYLLNLDPDLRVIGTIPDAMNAMLAYGPEPTPAVNSLRDHNVQTFTRALDSSSGPPRLDSPLSPPTTGPRIEGIWTRGTANNATALTADYVETNLYFPDRRAVIPQTWAVTWEGTLVGPRFSGHITADPSGLAPTLDDGGADFCGAGTVPGDLVTLVGCNTDNDCGFGKVCVHGTTGSQAAGGLAISGLCVDPVFKDRTVADCSELLATIRRYEVTTAQSNLLTLRPHRDELVRSSLQPCTPGSGGSGGSDGGTAAAGPDAGVKDDCPDEAADPTTKGFSCETDPDGQHRCLQKCDTEGSTEGCRLGRICVKYGQGADGKDLLYCADGPSILTQDAFNMMPPPPGAPSSCFNNEYTPYTVGVGGGFLVAGSQLGVPLTGHAGASRTCERDPNVNPHVVTRIPLSGPRCDPTLDNNFDSRCVPARTGTPCESTDPNKPADAATTDQSVTGLLKILQTPPTPSPCLFLGGPNTSDPPTTWPTHVHALFRNTQIAFIMTNLEKGPTSALGLNFDVHGGFRSQTVFDPATVEVSMPGRIMVGPFDSRGFPPNTAAGDLNAIEAPYLFVVDRRRLGLSQGGGPTRGQILRINPMFAIPSTGLQPIFEDRTASGNLFPIE